MSILFTEDQTSFSVNMDFFTSNEPLMIDSQLSNDKMLHDAPGLVTPPPKRRRGRPPKVVSGTGSNPSPAASLSAAVMKQGTPKTSSPLMRVSPLKTKKSAAPPFQIKMVNPSPKGGQLMKLDSSIPERSPSKPKRTSPKSLIASSSSSTKVTKTTNKVSFYQSLSPSQKISSSTQQNIESLTLSNDSQTSSVNPSLLLSSPISSSTKIREFQMVRAPSSIKKASKTKTRMDPPLSTVPLNSSPMTPLASSNSCFSSIMQSSPLYQGYYANQSSPGTSILNSSPVKYQMKPIEIFKKEINEELPKNPMNSPNLKPQSEEFDLIPALKHSETAKTKQDKSNYKVTLCIDETGQAKITKTVKKNSQPLFTRHESLMNISVSELTKSSITQPSLSMRSNSASQLDTMLKHQTTSSPTSYTHSQQDFQLFIEPSKMTNDPFFSDDLTDNFQYQHSSGNIQFNNGSLGIEALEKSNSHEDDDDMSYDARKALIKMLRRSV